MREIVRTSLVCREILEFEPTFNRFYRFTISDYNCTRWMVKNGKGLRFKCAVDINSYYIIIPI